MNEKIYPNEVGILGLTKQEYEERMNSLLDRISKELNSITDEISVLSSFSNLRYAQEQDHADEISHWSNEFQRQMIGFVADSIEKNNFESWEKLGRDIANENFPSVEKVYDQGSKLQGYLILLMHCVREKSRIPKATELAQFAKTKSYKLNAKDINQIEEKIGRLTQV